MDISEVASDFKENKKIRTANLETQDMIKQGQHAKDCSEKSEEIFQNSRICLKCGNAGHYMFCCPNDYSPEDLKEIQCYICKTSGHLCCVEFNDPGPRELSCYNCGELGHNGSKCERPVIEESIGTPPCYRANKVQRRNHAKKMKNSKGKKSVPSSELTKSHKKSKTKSEVSIQKIKHSKGKKSTPSNLVNSHKKAKTQHGGFSTPLSSMKSHNEYSYRNRWGSPATPINHQANFGFIRSATFQHQHQQLHSSRFHPIDGRNVLPSANFDFEVQFHSSRFHPIDNRTVVPSASSGFEGQFHLPRFHPFDNRNVAPSSSIDFAQQFHSPRFHPNDIRNVFPFANFDFERQFHLPRFHPNDGRNGLPSANFDFDRSAILHHQQFHLQSYGNPFNVWVRGNYC